MNPVVQVADWRRVDEVFIEHANTAPTAPCVSFEGNHWNWCEVNSLVDQFATAFTACGVSAGDRIALLSTPRPEYLLVLMAASRIGAVYVGLNPRYKAGEVAEALSRAAPRLLITLSSFEGQDFLELIRSAGVVVKLPPVVAFESVATCLDALRVLSVGQSQALETPLPKIATSDVAAIVFTSGTTGKPKAAMLSHKGLLLAASVQHARLNPRRPRYLCNLPVNHVGCLMNLTLSALVGGGSIVFQQRFSAAGCLQLIRDERVNCWLQVPAMFHECVRDPSFVPKELCHLNSICIGGGAVSAQTLAKLRQIGVPVFVEYGQTETTSSGSYSDDGATDEVLTHCIGRFDPHFEFRIANAANQPCAIGEVGEIQARGQLIFVGYFADPIATAEAFSSDGWLHTGDLAMHRTDGNVILQGRSKEMIKSGGYNVYPREVEQLLETHPGISQVVVVGIPDARYGEAVHAVISCSDETVTVKDLKDLCRQKLANYKVPKSFRVIPAFPLLSNGKIDRVGTRSFAGELPLLD
jgi:acyl-CoA synthetase (AMP-forming)/AMP-acid ligase II